MTESGHPADGETGATPVSLYVHVPFCLSRCAYCDFHSEAGVVGIPCGDVTRGEAFSTAIERLAREAASRGLLADVPSMYFGGGTPTVLGERLVSLVRTLAGIASLREDAEITVETNPETTDAALVSDLMGAGVGRFSLGVQSFDDAVLRTLGRRHDASGARRAAEILCHASVPFSVDLMCGVPGQSFESWDRTLEEAVSSGARHVSVYPLSVEEGTQMARSVADGTIPAPDQDAAAEMMLVAEVALAAAGMPRYEVANYAQPGMESRHNIAYWTGAAYLGLGPSAAGMLPVRAVVASLPEWLTSDMMSGASGCAARCRFVPSGTLDDLIPRGLAERPSELEWLTSDEAAREDVMLGLRMTCGVPARQVGDAGLSDVLADLAVKGLVHEWRDESGVVRWSTTQRGWLLGNSVFEAVWTAG